MCVSCWSERPEQPADGIFPCRPHLNGIRRRRRTAVVGGRRSAHAVRSPRNMPSAGRRKPDGSSGVAAASYRRRSLQPGDICRRCSSMLFIMFESVRLAAVGGVPAEVVRQSRPCRQSAVRPKESALTIGKVADLFAHCVDPLRFIGTAKKFPLRRRPPGNEAKQRYRAKPSGKANWHGVNGDPVTELSGHGT